MHSLSARITNIVVSALPRRHDERGASLVEYALLVALIAMVCIVAITFLGGEASESFESNGSSLFVS